MKRTHHCNELRPAHIGQTVTLAGWVHSRRDLGGLIFIDVRDREGRTQTVFDPSDLPKELFEQAAALRSECVVRVTGKVRQRPDGTNNPKIPTGEVEVMAQALEVLELRRGAAVPGGRPGSGQQGERGAAPASIATSICAGRRWRATCACAARWPPPRASSWTSRASWKSRRRSSSRPRPKARANSSCRTAASPGTFYALPQSPQQFKQILMVAGVERYYPDSPAASATRTCAPTASSSSRQIDIEMSFIEREDIYALIEGLLKRIWKTALNIDVPTPFKRLSFEEAHQPLRHRQAGHALRHGAGGFHRGIPRQQVQGLQRRGRQPAAW